MQKGTKLLPLVLTQSNILWSRTRQLPQGETKDMLPGTLRNTCLDYHGLYVTTLTARE